MLDRARSASAPSSCQRFRASVTSGPYSASIEAARFITSSSISKAPHCCAAIASASFLSRKHGQVVISDAPAPAASRSSPSWSCRSSRRRSSPRSRPDPMRSTTVASVDWLGEMPDQDAGAEPVLRIETDLPAGEDNTFYMDVVDPRPQAGRSDRLRDRGRLSRLASRGRVERTGAFASAATPSTGCRTADSGRRAGMRRGLLLLGRRQCEGLPQ